MILLAQHSKSYLVLQRTSEASRKGINLGYKSCLWFHPHLVLCKPPPTSVWGSCTSAEAAMVQIARPTCSLCVSW